jgi:hypothetical protein
MDLIACAQGILRRLTNPTPLLFHSLCAESPVSTSPATGTSISDHDDPPPPAAPDELDHISQPPAEPPPPLINENPS